MRINCFILGMAVKGGSDTPYKNVYVRELIEGGAVHKDGFVQVQPAVKYSVCHL